MQAYKSDTLHSRSIYKIAKFFKSIKDTDSTRMFIDKGLIINANDAKFIRLKISDLYKNKKYNKSLEFALHLDTVVQNDLFAKQRIGLCYWKLKDFTNAEKYLKQAVRIDRNEKSTYYYLGLIYKDLQDFKSAKFYFTIAVTFAEKLDVDNEYYNLGLIAQHEKNPKVAIDYLKKSYQSNNYNYPALFELAVTSDLYYKDKSIVLKHYEKYANQFADKHKENTEYVAKRIKEIKEMLFFNN